MNPRFTMLFGDKEGQSLIVEGEFNKVSLRKTIKPMEITGTILKNCREATPTTIIEILNDISIHYGSNMFHCVPLLLSNIIDYDFFLNPDNENKNPPLDYWGRSSEATPAESFYLEIRALRRASQWLDMDELPRIDGSLFNILAENPDFNGITNYFLAERCKQSRAHFAIIDGKKPRIIESDNLLILAWSEIWFYLEHYIPGSNSKNNLRFRICPYCETVFQVPYNNIHKRHCQSSACKDKYLLVKHDGKEGLRKSWRDAKRGKTSGKRGRPPKKKTKEGE